MRCFVVAGLLVVTSGLLPAAWADDAELLAADQEVLKKANIEIDDAGLMEYFRKRTLFDADIPKVKELVRKLGDDVFVSRNRATNELIAMGATARPMLHEALTNEDAEVVRRARTILETIDRNLNPAASQAAARMLARRKPAGATEVLFGFLPFAEDESVADEVRMALTALAVRDGKPDKVLLDGTTDKLAVRRAGAVEALLRGKAIEPAEGRKFLTDKDPLVRLGAGLALAQREDKEAVAPLITLLADLPRERAWQVEDVLCRLAGEQAPAVSLGDDDATRAKCRDAWAAWWQKNADKADLKRLADGQHLLGFTLIASLDQRNQGKVYEIGVDGKERWSIKNLNFPIDAQVLPGERVLIAEMNGNRVTERDFKGKILWEKNHQMPLAVQRLPNGNTFIAGRNGLIEYDRAGKEVFKHERGDFSIFGATKLRNGEYGIVTSFGTFIRLDSKGKEVKNFNVGQTQSLCVPDALPSGRVLIPLWGNGKVVEYDPDGKEVWSGQVNNPVSAMRLPNGNTLVASMGSGKVVELDRNGKQVWEHKTDGRPWRVRRR
jgi:outer membrane protein assembly factor BamB